MKRMGGFLFLFLLLGCITRTVYAQSPEKQSVKNKAVVLNGYHRNESTYAGAEKSADAIERILQEQGYDVSRYRTPYSDLSAVGRSLYGAKIVVYYGHGIIHSGNIFNPTSYDVGGLQLGSYIAKPAELRREIRFASNALIFLPTSCFASGNCIEDRGKVSRPILEKRMAVYAQAFIDCGATLVLSGADENRFLKEFFRTKDVSAAYAKAAGTGKETTTTIDRLRIRYREEAGRLIGHSAIVTKE